MHPTAEAKAAITRLQDQIDALTARLAKIEPVASAAEAAAEAEIAKAQAAAAAKAELSRQHDEWLLATKAKAEAAEAERVRRSLEGLPRGQYRDPCGLVRESSTGKLVARVEREAAELEAIGKQQAAEHRSWKRLVDLPVLYPVAGEDDEPSTNDEPNSN
jgi:hypothetical protein